MPKRKGPRKLWPQQKKRALKALGKTRLSLTKTQRREMHAAMERFVGYKIPTLHRMGIRKPGNYTVKSREIMYDTEKVWVPGEETGHFYKRYGPGKTIVVRGKAIGEKLVIKSLSKKSGQGKGSSSADRGISHKTGTMKARKSAKAGKRGMRFGRELKKQKQKK